MFLVAPTVSRDWSWPERLGTGWGTSSPAPARCRIIWFWASENKRLPESLLLVTWQTWGNWTVRTPHLWRLEVCACTWVIRELLQSDHLENVPMRPDAGPCLPDPEVEVPVVITIELLHAAGSQPVQPCQQLLCLGLIIQIVKPCVKDKKLHACLTWSRQGLIISPGLRTPSDIFVVSVLYLVNNLSVVRKVHVLLHTYTWFQCFKILIYTHVMSTNQNYCLHNIIFLFLANHMKDCL